MTTPPVRYTQDVEDLQADEAQTVRQITETFDIILEKTAEDYGHAVRSVHAKAHGILEGEMIVHDHLPAELAQGVFARPGRHKVYLRISTNAGDILPDDISLPRGLVMKVLDVAGERLPGAEGTAQDFLLVNSKVFQAKDAETFLGSLKMLAKTTGKMVGAKKVMSAALRGVRGGFEAVGAEAPATVTALGGAPNVEPLGETYYSTVPFRYGDYIAKFSMAPATPAMRALSGKVIDIAGRENAIRDELQKELRGSDAKWLFRVQLCRDLEKQPIEDATVEWDEEAAPFVTVATIQVAAQDSWDAARVEKVNEKMRFSPWTGIEAHRPLGNVNRARRGVYRHSADFRAGFNHCPNHEPNGAGD